MEFITYPRCQIMSMINSIPKSSAGDNGMNIKLLLSSVQQDKVRRIKWNFRSRLFKACDILMQFEEFQLREYCRALCHAQLFSSDSDMFKPILCSEEFSKWLLRLDTVTPLSCKPRYTSYFQCLFRWDIEWGKVKAWKQSLNMFWLFFAGWHIVKKRFQFNSTSQAITKVLFFILKKYAAGSGLARH